MRKLLMPLLICCVLTVACKQQNDNLFSFNVRKTVLLDSLSSGSGLVFSSAKNFVLSDNVNGFFMLDTSRLTHQFIGFDTAPSHIQTKDVKEDFENATELTLGGKECIIAFGSGSIEKTREKILMIPVDSPLQFKLLPASNFYQAAKQTLGIETTQMNIEACFADKDSIYLLNRGTNQSISIRIPDFEKAINSGFGVAPAMNKQQFKLPVVDGFNASFSGACFYQPGVFIFSATVEKTTNWVDDGAVGGSFIGIAEVNGRIRQVLPLQDKNHQAVLEKIESVEWFKKKGDNSIIYAISDNDNGKSTWFIIECSGL